MRVSFIGRIASNHTAFIRIKASLPAPLQELLILPVEVEVTSGEKEVLLSLVFFFYFPFLYPDELKAEP